MTICLNHLGRTSSGQKSKKIFSQKKNLTAEKKSKSEKDLFERDHLDFRTKVT